MKVFTIQSTSLENTAEIAQKIAPLFKKEDVVIFEGNLGAGKTHFVKFLAAALGYEGLVTSPTYTIASVYDWAAGKILHIDGYRLTSLSEFVDLGLDAYFAESISMIEWAGEFEDEFPHYLKIKLEYLEAEMSRKITFSYLGERWDSDFEKIKNSLQKFQ
jgi:tRNA threonylcarbamoyladenosine biosynthesis protein TsaE